MVRQFIRPCNLLMSGASYIGSLISKDWTMIMAMPVSVSTELTNKCNLRCPECSAGSGQMKRPGGFMDIVLFKKIVKEIGPFLYNINLYFQGEPMLHPHFFNFLENCKGIHSTVSTNGLFLTAENSDNIVNSGLSKLIISIDGARQESYSAYRVNGDLGNVINGLKAVSEARIRNRSGMKLEIQLLVNRFNEDQIGEMRILASRYGAALTLKSMQIINNENTGFWLPGDKKFRRYKLDGGEYVNKNRMPDRCARLWFNPVITWDGKVIPCCFDKDGDHIMGDLNQDSFSEIWNGPRYRVFRRAILRDRSMIEICRNCTSGLKGVRY